MGGGGGYAVSSGLEPMFELRDMPAASTLQMIITTVCFAGVQFGWALQISLLTPFILELGMPPAWITIVWLCGPISGLLVQPTVGVVSDFSTHKLGRRRPFIILGALFVTFALLLIPNAPDLGRLMGDSTHHNPAAILLAVLGFWILDLANNTLQGPVRSLLVDVARPEQQSRGNAIFSVWLAIGNVLGYLAGWAPWSTWMPWWQSESCDVACADLRCAFTISIVFLLVTVITTCVFTKEKPLQESALTGKTRPPIFSKIFGLIRHLPLRLSRICVVQFFSWFAWFAFLIYITNWVGLVVNNGDPQADHDSDAYKRYVDGVQMGSFGLAFYAIFSAVTSPVVALMAEKLGPRWTWFSGQLVMAVLLFCTAFVENMTAAAAVIALFGYPWSVSMTVPFAMTAQVSPPADRGLYMGALNIFVVLPQCAMAVLGPGMVSIFGDKGAVIAALELGAIGSVLACIVIPRLITNPPKGELHTVEIARAPEDVASSGSADPISETTILLSE